MPRPLVRQQGDTKPPCYWKNVKNLASSEWSWAIGLLLVPLFTGCFSRTTSVTEDTPAVEAQAAPQEVADDSDISPPEGAPTADVPAPPFKLVTSEITVPASVRLSDVATEVVKLANAGMEESVMLAFITNSPGTFNLGPEEIIYLADIGVGAGIIKAMLVHDHNNPDVTIAPIAAAQPSPSFEPLLPVEPSGPLPYAAPPTQFDYANYSPEPAPEEASTAEPDFYEDLAPYGNWVDVGGYGVCWQPTVAVCNSEWRPYFDRGRWVYTDCGWYWSSEYSWGWAPFHYGRWFQHPTLHWCWVPDKVWGPSWVSWRFNDSYCGWAPLPPGAQFTVAGMFFKGHPAAPDCQFGLTASAFRFVPSSRICDSKLDHCVVRPSEASRAFAQTTVSTGIRRHHQTVVNNGLPASRGGVTTTPVVALRPRHVETPYGNRERFEANGRTLAIPQTTSLVPVAPASTPTGPVGETRHVARPSAASNPAQNEASRNVLAQRAPTSQPIRHLNASASAPVQMAAYMPPAAAPASPAASPAASTPTQPAQHNSLVVIGHKGASSNPSHHSPYVYYASPPPQPEHFSSVSTTPAAATPHPVPGQSVAHVPASVATPINSQAQWWVPSQPSAQPMTADLPRRHDYGEAFNGSAAPPSYSPPSRYSEPPQEHSAPAHQPQNDPPAVSRHEQPSPPPQHSDPAPQAPQPHSHDTSSSSSSSSSTSSSSSSSSSGRH